MGIINIYGLIGVGSARYEEWLASDARLYRTSTLQLVKTQHSLYCIQSAI